MIPPVGEPDRLPPRVKRPRLARCLTPLTEADHCTPSAARHIRETPLIRGRSRGKTGLHPDRPSLHEVPGSRPEGGRPASLAWPTLPWSGGDKWRQPVASHVVNSVAG
jgi:hypothetical protein